jgi:hypothetical protein
MSITYPKSQKANPYPQPKLAPTPQLRAEAAVGEAISHFFSVARAGGVIGVLSMMMLTPALESEGNWRIWLPFAILLISGSLSLSAVDLRPASKRAKFRSGLEETFRTFDAFYWLRWVGFVGTSASGIVCLFWHKQIGLSFSDGMMLFSLLMIVGQLISILTDTLQGVKLLRFAQSVTDEATQPQVREPYP